MNAQLKADSLSNNPANLVEEYYRLNPEGHFFDKDTMKFFNSKIVRSPIKVVGEHVLFITSEKMDHNSPRKFEVRAMSLAAGKIISRSGPWRTKELAIKEHALIINNEAGIT